MNPKKVPLDCVTIWLHLNPFERAELAEKYAEFFQTDGGGATRDYDRLDPPYEMIGQTGSKTYWGLPK